MATTRSRSGEQQPSERRHVGLTLPRQVKERAMAAAEALEWSLGDWVLAVAAEHGPRLRDVTDVEVRKRPAVEDPTFCALYLTPDERDELDDQAVACGLNRSAFVTAVARLGLADPLHDVVESVTGRRPDVSAETPSSVVPQSPQEGEGEDPGATWSNAAEHGPTGPEQV